MSSYEGFVKRLKDSDPVVDAGVEWLKRQGFEAHRLKRTITPSYEERWSHVDHGDAMARKGVDPFRIAQVKQKKFLHFTCAKDYKYNTVFLDEQYKVDNLEAGSLLCHIVFNASMSHLCVAWHDTTRHRWMKTTSPDKNYPNRTLQLYVIDKRLCEFYKF